MSIRYTILKALHQHGAATLDELIDATGETRRRLQDNLAAALKDDLCERIRDDVTGQPAYRITKYGVARMNARNGITAAKSKPQPQPVEAPQAQPAKTETRADEELPPADPALLASANRMLGERLADTQSALDLMRRANDKALMENAGLVELIHTLKLENDTLQARVATLEGNLELPACSPDAASRNPGPSLGWLAVVAGKTYGSETEARLAATAICTDETELEQYGESIAVAQIVAIAEPIVAVRWQEAA